MSFKYFYDLDDLVYYLKIIYVLTRLGSYIEFNIKDFTRFKMESIISIASKIGKIDYESHIEVEKDEIIELLKSEGHFYMHSEVYLEEDLYEEGIELECNMCGKCEVCMERMCKAAISMNLSKIKIYFDKCVNAEMMENYIYKTLDFYDIECDLSNYTIMDSKYMESENSLILYGFHDAYRRIDYISEKECINAFIDSICG